MPDEVHICDYDPRWPALFAAEAPRVRAAFGEELVLAVEHFGSPESIRGRGWRPSR